MVQTKAGAAKVRDKNLARDPDFYVKIGKIGGSRGHTGGFYGNPELARIAGRKGGYISRRGKAKKTFDPYEVEFPPVSIFDRIRNLFRLRK